MRCVAVLLVVCMLPVVCTVAACGSDARRPVEPDAARAAFASADPARIDPILARLTAADVDWLIAGLTHVDRGVREWSVHALGDLAPKEERVVDALMKAFEDEDDWVRWKAARALGNLGPFARRALPLLDPAANAEKEGEVVRAAAQVAVKQIRGE